MMRAWMILALLASSAAAQPPELKTILDANAASYAAVANVTYDYHIDWQTPEQKLLPTSTEHGTYKALDAHHRYFDDERPMAGGTAGGKAVDRVDSAHRRTVLSDHLLATWFISWPNPVAIYEFDDPDAVPNNAYTIGFFGVERGFHSMAFGNNEGSLRAVIAPEGLTPAHRTEIVSRPDGCVELRVRYGTDSEPTRIVAVDPACGYLVREHRVYDTDHTTLRMRMIATVASMADHPGVAFPTTIECWEYKHDKSAQSVALQDHYKATFSNVTIGTAKLADFTLAALQLPELIGVARTEANGKMDTCYMHNGQPVDFDTLYKLGLAQKANEFQWARAKELAKERGR